MTSPPPISALMRHLHRQRRDGDVLRAACDCGHPSSGGPQSRLCRAVHRDEDGHAPRLADEAWDAVGRYYVEGRELRPFDRVTVITGGGRSVTGPCVGAAEGDEGIEVWVADPLSGDIIPSTRGHCAKLDRGCWHWAPPASP